MATPLEDKIMNSVNCFEIVAEASGSAGCSIKDNRVLYLARRQLALLEL